MKRLFILISVAAIALPAACTKNETSATEEKENRPPREVVITASIEGAAKASLDAEGKFSWTTEDKLSVYCTDGAFHTFDCTEGGTSGTFSATLDDGVSTSTVAVYPAGEYSLSGNTLTYNLPAELTYSATLLPCPMVAKIASEGSVSLSFKHIGGILRLSFHKIPLIARKLVFTSNNKSVTGSFSVDLGSETPHIAASGAGSSLTVNFASGDIADDMTFNLPMPTGTFDDFSVSFVDDKGAAMAWTTSTATSSANTIARAQLRPMPGINLGLKLNWAYGSDWSLPRFAGAIPAIDKDGNVYFQAANEKLVKLKADGAKDWEYTLNGVPGSRISPSVEADGSVVYAGGGANGSVHLYGINSDGSLKWDMPTSSFWGNGANPNPSLNMTTIAVGPTCIYSGNGGTTGTVLSVNKTTGERVAYVCANADGTGGPAGGCYTGVTVTKGGAVTFGARYGFYGAWQQKLDSPDMTHATYGKYVPYGTRHNQVTFNGNSTGGIACTVIGGKNYFVHQGYTGSSAPYKLLVYAVLEDDALDESPSNSQANNAWNVTLENVQKQDQGGLVTGLQNEVIVSLKNNASGVRGGIYAIATDGTKAYDYAINADVGGSCGVDNNGYIHVLADNPGVYYILRPDYANKTCDLVYKEDITGLAKSNGITLEELETAIRLWTSVKFGPSGEIVLAAETSGNNKRGLVLNLKYPATTGAGNTPWPQKAADCGNRSVQL